MRAAVVWLAAAMMSCTTSTEVRYVHCDTMEVFRSDSVPVLADSVRFTNCDAPTWEGTVIRRKRP